MISHGDEIARTQQGNNNAYAQDNEISWMRWDLDERREALLDFTRKLIALRQSNPVLRRRHFFRGQVVEETGHKDVTWLAPGGQEMTDAEWNNAANHALGMLIDGDATDETDARGRPIKGDTLLVLLNGGEHQVYFKLPAIKARGRWTELLDTAEGEVHTVPEKDGVTVAPYGILLLRYGRDRRLAATTATRAELVGAGAAQ
jgi:glycogen operon protein